MSKYKALWEHVGKSDREKFALSYGEIEEILGFPIDHSFLNFKKELTEYGYAVKKISMKNNIVEFEKTKEV